MVRKTRVLFLCVGNTARSQMAEAFLRAHGGDRFEARSAGLKPREIEPLAITVMQELGYFDYLITLCNRAERGCPHFAGMGERLSWPFEDPATFAGTEEELLARFGTLRDDIEQFIRRWVEERPVGTC